MKVKKLYEDAGPQKYVDSATGKSYIFDPIQKKLIPYDPQGGGGGVGTDIEPSGAGGSGSKPGGESGTDPGKQGNGKDKKDPSGKGEGGKDSEGDKDSRIGHSNYGRGNKKRDGEGRSTFNKDDTTEYDPLIIGAPMDQDDLDAQDAAAQKQIQDEIDQGYGAQAGQSEDEVRQNINKLNDKDFRKQLDKDVAADVDKINVDKMSRIAAQQAEEEKKERIARLNNVDYSSLPDWAEFKNDILQAMKSQISRLEKDPKYRETYTKMNKYASYYNPNGIIKKGKKKLDKIIPSIRLYYDCSVSFNEKDHKAVDKVVAVLDELEHQGKLVVQKRYFGSDTKVARSKDGVVNCGTIGRPIIRDIQNSFKPAGLRDDDYKKDPKDLNDIPVYNTVVITDHDITDIDPAEVTIPGYAFFIFRGSASGSIYAGISTPDNEKMRKAYSVESLTGEQEEEDTDE